MRAAETFVFVFFTQGKENCLYLPRKQKFNVWLTSAEAQSGSARYFLWQSLAIKATSSSIRIGLDKCIFIPAARHFCASSPKALAVMATMGMVRASSRISARIARVAWSP